MAKKQKVRFHKGDKRPGGRVGKLNYNVEMAKKGKKLFWNVVEEPSQNIVARYFFEEDATKLADFHNEHRVWQENGGIPKFLWNYIP